MIDRERECLLVYFGDVCEEAYIPWFAEFTANAAGAAIAPTIDSAAIKAVVLMDIIFV
ncbi:MAG TPA: hypothetical protein VE692_03250 [Nitrososphaera sp.]|nr:hypothetical protein [Nitrososphaera sp.]